MEIGGLVFEFTKVLETSGLIYFDQIHEGLVGFVATGLQVFQIMYSEETLRSFFNKLSVFKITHEKEIIVL